MSELLRLSLLGLLTASLGCDRRAPPTVDAGAPSLARAESRPPLAPPAADMASVQGRVSWRGEVPVLPRLRTGASVQSVCGPSVADNALRVDAKGGVADVVVWVDTPPGPPPAAAPGQQVVLDQRGCLYEPPVLAARAGGSVRLRNSDPLTHTVHALSGGQTLFNVALPLEHMELTRQLPAEPGVVDVRCDVHPWMHAVVRTFDHPHFSTTDAEGRFRLPGLAAGEWTVHAWHPRLGELSRPVKVGPGPRDTDFEFGGPP